MQLGCTGIQKSQYEQSDKTLTRHSSDFGYMALEIFLIWREHEG